jgi:porin
MKRLCAAMLGLVNATVFAIPTSAEEKPSPSRGTDIAEDTFVSSRSSLIESFSEKDHLLSDWGGVRTRLVERGIHFQAGYIGEVMGNLSGGLKRGAVYEGLFESGVTFDLEKLTDAWRGGIVRASMLYPHGKSPSGELIGDLQGASNIDAYDSVALYEWWFEQNFWQNRVSLRLGQQLADQEFTTTASGGLFLNSSFGWPAFISGNTHNNGPAYYRASLGARLWVEPVKNLYLQAGVYDGDTFDDRAGSPKKNPHGTNVRLSSDQGAFAIAEAGLRLNYEKDARFLPGTYKLGAWLHTAEFEDVMNPSETHGQNFGAYLAIEQNVWREDRNEEGFDQGLSAFFRL